MTKRVFNRRVHFDERSRNYPIRTLLAADEPRSYTWRVSLNLDQGSEGACVGYAWAHEAAGRPAEVSGVTASVAREVYREAQKIDYWPGENYEGTSVLAGAKIGKSKCWFKEYRWAFGLNDVLVTVSRKGPVVLGLNWYSGMDEPVNGVIRATGTLMGGHAIVANGVSIKRQTVRLHNSWGPAWGINGEADISWDDLNRLLYEQGEACVPVYRMRP